MKMKFKKRVLRLFLLGIAILFAFPFKVAAVEWLWSWEGNGFYDVSGSLADGLATCEYLERKGSTLHEKYEANITYDGEEEVMVITIDKELPANIKFKVAGIRVTDVTDRKNESSPSALKYAFTSHNNSIAISNGFGLNTETDKLTAKNPLYLNTLTFDTPGIYRYEVVLFPEGFQDQDIERECKGKGEFTFYIKLTIEVGQKIADQELGTDTVEPEPPAQENKTIIECGEGEEYKEKYKGKTDSFAYKYCDLKYAADHNNATSFISYTQDKNTYAKYVGSDTPLTYKCNENDFVSHDPSASDYYKNVNYLHGQIVNDITENYVYHYGCNVITKHVSCKIKCDEYVSVEYGPPIAATAGMCFQYKVKVTSRVNCEMSGPGPSAPQKKGRLCTPVPACLHGGEDGWIGEAAGPTEDFDACVDACDGGKYTNRCNIKCYNQVYGFNQATAQANSFVADFPTIAEQISSHGYHTETHRKDCDFKGRYTCENGWAIRWESAETSKCPKNSYGLARYYQHIAQYRDGDWGCIKNEDEGGGIASVCGCTAVCQWTGCRGDYYLNPGDYKADYKKNMEIYENLKNKCNTYSKCSTTQSEFTISASYTAKGDTQETTVHFPALTETDDPNAKATIKNENNSISCSPSIEQQSNIFLGTDYCYNCNQNGGSANSGTGSENINNAHAYQAEWTFPGTWVSIKPVEIRYYPVKGYLKFDKLFCLPPEIEDVNQDWYNKFFLLKSEKEEYSYNSKTTTEKKACNLISCSEPTIDVNGLNYNVKASTRKFGLFEWNIDMKCFYALNSKFPEGSNGKSVCTYDCDTPTPLGKAGVSVRNVDLANLFPASNGESLNSPDKTGRAAGFNWTEFANTSSKDPAYVSDPKNYRTWVQNIKYDVYDDQYLDYDIYLYKDDIAKLQQANSKTKDFNKSPLTSSIDSVTHYRSNLFRDGALLKEFHVPSEQALKCNNIKNYLSNDCFIVEGE